MKIVIPLALMSLLALLPAFGAPVASASCTVNTYQCDGGNCTVNAAFASCSDGAGCAVNVDATCSTGGACDVNVLATCSASCAVNVWGATCKTLGGGGGDLLQGIVDNLPQPFPIGWSVQPGAALAPLAGVLP